MGIQDCGERLFKPTRNAVTLDQYHGERLAVDIASFKLKAWYSDVAHYYRPTVPPTHGYRTNLANLLSALSAGHLVKAHMKLNRK